MQRRRLLTAVLAVVGEGGVAAVTSASVSQRAGVSRRTFYELFGDREACLLAAFDHGVDRAVEAVAPSLEGQQTWRARMRAALTALLIFFEAEPPVARLLIVEAAAAGAGVVERRAQIADRLSAFVDHGLGEPRADAVRSPVTAEAVVGAVIAVVQARLLDR